MRPFDRDLIRGGHYGQRSREPRSKAEHMAAPTNPAPVKKTLANSEPSTHGPLAAITATRISSACEGNGWRAMSAERTALLESLRQIR
jgi:hypothetical protein